MVRLRVHDPYSMELDLEVPLDRGSSELQAWFFLPAQLGVDEPVFDRDRYYRDLTVYVRYQSPRRELAEADVLIAPLTDAGAERSLRLYAACIRAQLRVRGRALRDILAAGDDPEPTILRLVAESEALLGRHRERRARARDVTPQVSSSLAAIEDFLSMQALELWFRVHERAPHPALSAAILSETAIREAGGLHGPLDAADALDNERFVTRLNRLKKYVLGALHLRFVSTRRAQNAQDLAFGIAAALAMTVAVGLQLVAAWTFGTPGGPREWASLLPFLGFAVGGYILKDRLKDHLKGWFAQRLPQWLFDRRLDLCPESAASPLGVAEETVRLLHMAEVDPQIAALRARGDDAIEHVVRASDDVIHYRRVLRLGRQASANCPEAQAIEQILRFNIRDWLRRMDEPNRELFQLDDDGFAHRIQGPKTYRIPVVLAVNNGGKREIVHRVLVLSRDGIVRIAEPTKAADGGSGGAQPPVV